MRNIKIRFESENEKEVERELMHKMFEILGSRECGKIENGSGNM